MMNLNNVNGLIDLKTWQTCIKQLPNLQLFHEQSIQKIFELIPKYKNLPPNAIMTLMCGDISRFDEVLAFYQACAKHQLLVEVYMPKTLKTKWLSFTSERNCLIPPLYANVIKFNEQRWLYVDLLSNLSSRALASIVEPWMMQINAQDTPVLALDLPSGLDANTGSVITHSPIYADLVISRGAFLQGLFTGMAKAFIGQTHLLQEVVMPITNYQSYLLNSEQIRSLMPQNIAYAYKGMYGRVMIIAGEKEMFGASLLAARAALITGSGWVEVFYQQGLTPPFGSLPEIIWHEVNDVNTILSAIQVDDILVFGPGLGEGGWAKTVWQTFSDLDNKMVLDASALHFLAKSQKKRQNCIITPHPGEAALLLDTTNTSIQVNRYDAIRKLYHCFQSEVVLKGSGSLIYTKEDILYVCPHGNPAMASQGMGDVLTGLIAGLWARLGESSPALLVGVWLHANAADSLLEKNPGMIAIRASQVLDEIENHMQDLLCK